MPNMNTFTKVIICCLCFLMMSAVANAQVDNDICEEATVFPALTDGVESCVSGANVGAFGELPYINQATCIGGVPMPAPSADIWYSFTAVGNILDVTLFSDLEFPVIAFYEGDCDALIGRYCEVGVGGVIVTEFAPVAPGVTYYIQLSGFDIEDQGVFDLCLNNYTVLEEICMLGQELAVTPPPILGAYQPGQEVTFCFTIGGYEQNAADWVHGIVPVFGPGWDVPTLSFPVPFPASCDGSGEWGWYDSVLGTAGSALPDPQGPGFFYDSSAGGPFDGDPGNNFGDNNVASACMWSFCFALNTLECPPAENDTDLSIEFLNFSDAETGSWNSSSPCPNDPNYVFKAILVCCVPPEMTAVHPNCASPGGGSITATGMGIGPYTFEWSNDVVETGVETSTIDGLVVGFYTVTVTDDEDCVSFGSFELEADDMGAENVQIPVSTENCDGCIAGPDSPQDIHIVAASDGSIFATVAITSCPEIIDICLPDDDTFGLQYGEQSIEEVVLGGVLNGEDTFLFFTPSEIPVSLDAVEDLCTTDDSRTLNGTPSGGTYSGNGVTGDTFDPAEADAGEHTITYEYSDPETGCFGSASIEITVAPVSDPGTMPSDLVALCHGDATSLSAEGVNLLGDDILAYVLHDSPDATIDNVIASNSAGVFSVAADGLQTNTLYYVSTVTGIEGSTPGLPDLNYACLNSNAGTPVVFLKKVVIETDDSCDDDTYELTVIFNIWGGLPEYDPTEQYIVTGSFAGLMSFGAEEQIGPLPGGDSYSINAMDALGCAAAPVGVDSIDCKNTPIELLDFSGRVLEEGNLLEWQTATEYQNDFFTLYRSIDGISFEEIAKIEASGTTTSLQTYELLDRDAPNGISYYQLSQTDYDGSTSRSNVISLTRTDHRDGEITMTPIPAHNFIQVSFQTTSLQTTVSVHDVAGRLIEYQDVKTEAGRNEWSLDVSSYSPGVYFLTVDDGIRLRTEKIVKE